MDHAISMSNVRKTFGKKVAVAGLDLEVKRGALLGLIGPNGAGKTTSIRMIMSILFPDSGELSVLGKKSAVESKDRIGYLPEERGVYKKMKVGAVLRYMATLKDVPTDGLNRKINDWLVRVDLADVAKKKCEELSKGMQQKVQFIASVLHEPELLILDEPFSGLDPVNMRLLRDLIREQHERGTTVIFSTHVMAQAQDICDRVVMIHQGEKVLDDTIGDIRKRHETRIIEFEPLDPAGLESLHVDGMVASARRTEKAWEADIGDGVEPARALAALTSAVPVSRAELRRPTLEDVFIGIVTGGGDAAATEEQLRAQLRAGAVSVEEGAE